MIDNPLVDFIMQEWRLICLLLVIFLLYHHYTSTFDHFRGKGIPFMKPYIFLGNLAPRLTMKLSIHEFTLMQYDHFKGLPYGGIFEGKRPSLLLRDPDLIKAVLITNFDCFVDRRVMNSNEPGYLSRSLLNLKGQEWKAVRKSLTPTFSSTRLRAMFELMKNCTHTFCERLTSSDIEMKDLWGNYTLDVIGSCAFGIEATRTDGEASQFVETAAKFADMPIKKRVLIFFLLLFAPWAFKYLNISFLNTDTTKVLIQILNENKRLRRTSGMKREDFLQILLDTAQKDLETSGSTVLDEDTIDAQSLLFLIAGYETSSTLLGFASYTLATHPEIQDKLRDELRMLSAKYPEGFNYDSLSEMHLLEAVLLETLRLYPPLARVDRVCTRKFVLPGTNVEVQPGDVVQIPLYGLHLDGKYYENPRDFRPSRFLNGPRTSVLFLPFGVGPRNCIGLRFAMVSAKIALANFLLKYELKVCDRTEVPIRFSKKGILLKAQNGIWVRVDKIEN